jgi:hypothetical protein
MKVFLKQREKKFFTPYLFWVCDKIGFTWHQFWHLKKREISGNHKNKKLDDANRLEPLSFANTLGMFIETV